MMDSYKIIRILVFVIAFVLSFYGMSAVRFEAIIKKNHTLEAQILYWLIVMSLTYLSGSLVLSLI